MTRCKPCMWHVLSSTRDGRLLQAEPATEVIAARLYNDPSLNPAESALKERRAYIAAIRVRLACSQSSPQDTEALSRNTCLCRSTWASSSSRSATSWM